MACLNELLGAGLVLATITFLSLPAQSKMADFQIRRTRLFILLLTAILVVSFLNLAIEIHRSNGDPDFSITLLTTIYTFPIIIQLDHLIFSESPDWRLCRLWWMAMMAIDSLDLLEDFRKPQPREQCFLYTVLASCVRWCLTLALFVIFHCDPRDRIVPGKDKRSTAQKRDRRLVDSIRSSGGILHWMHKFRIFLPWIVPQSPTEWAQLAMCILLGWCQTRLLQWNFRLRESLFKSPVGAARPQHDLLMKALRLCFVKFACSGCGVTALKSGISDHVTMNRSTRAANDIYAFIIRHDASFHSSVNPTELKASIDRGVGLLRNFDNLVLKTLPQMYELISAVRTLLDTYGASVTMMVLYLYAVTLVMTVRVEKMISPILQAFGRAGIEGRRLMQNALAYWRTIHHCGQEAFEIGRLATVMDEQRALKAEHLILSFLGHLVTGLTELLEDAMALSIVVARGFEHHDDTLRNIATFWHVEGLVRNPWKHLCIATTSLLRSLLEADDLRRVLEIKPTISYGSEMLRRPHGDIVLNSICYYLPGSTRLLFYDLTLTCKVGEITAIVGPSGSGKTTLLNLITRTQDPHGGIVTIGSQNLKDLKKLMFSAYMPQDGLIFPDESIRFNIGYGCQEASTEEIESTAKRAGIHQDIVATPQGYDGTVGREGQKFSGGQRQRIALARTLLLDLPVVLLDEATSAQDQRTENFIKQSIALLRKNGKTVVLVAHRLSTINNADKIIVLKRDSEGRTVVAESGTHEELLALQGEYAGLWNAQTSTVGTKE